MLDVSRLKANVAVITISMLCGLAGFLAASYYQLTTTAYRVVYQYWPQAEGFTPLQVKELSMDKMLPLDKAELQNLLNNSGILSDVQDGLAQINRQSLLQIEKAQKGINSLVVLPAEGNIPLARINWQSNHAPNGIQPLLQFLDKKVGATTHK